MNIDELSVQAGKSKRTIQRWIAAYNKTNNTSFDNGVNAIINDPDLLSYLKSKFEPQPTLFEPSATIEQPVEQSIVKEKKRPDTPKKRSVVSLQQRLSADWLVIVVLLVILWADMFAFGSIGHHEFGDKITFAAVVFSIIGLATGIGSVVTYNRIKDAKTAEIWKWCFGVLQFAVFSLAINEQWVFAEMVMTSMFVLVFIGVQRSIKK